MATWLSRLTIAIPLVGALAIWLLVPKMPLARLVTAIASAGGTALSALGLIFLPGAGVLARVSAGETDLVILIGGSILTVAGLGLAARFWLNYRRRRQVEPVHYYALLLLITGGGAGVLLVKNFLLWLLCWALLTACPFILLHLERRRPKP